MVIDADSGKTLADIPGQKHNHGVALVPEAGRGFISDGSGAVVIFDLQTNAVLGTITARPDADGIIFDKASGLVLVVSGDDAEIRRRFEEHHDAGADHVAVQLITEPGADLDAGFGRLARLLSLS